MTIPRSVGRKPIGSIKTKRCLKNCVKHCLIEIKQTKVCYGPYNFKQIVLTTVQKSIIIYLPKSWEAWISPILHCQLPGFIIRNILSESPLNTVLWWRFSYLVTTLLSFTRSSSTKHLRANKVEVKTSYPNWHCHPGKWSLKTWVDQSSCYLLDYTNVTVYVGYRNLRMLDIYYICNCLSIAIMSTAETFEDTVFFPREEQKYLKWIEMMSYNQ